MSSGEGSIQNRLEVEPRRLRPEGAPAFAGEAGRAEGIGDCLRRMAYQQRALHRQHQALGEAARARLGVGRIHHLGLERGNEAVEPRIAATRLLEFGTQGRQRVGERPAARSMSRS